MELFYLRVFSDVITETFLQRLDMPEGRGSLFVATVIRFTCPPYV